MKLIQERNKVTLIQQRTDTRVAAGEVTVNHDTPNMCLGECNQERGCCSRNGDDHITTCLERKNSGGTFVVSTLGSDLRESTCHRSR